VKKGNSGSGYASVLSAAVVVDSSSANRTAQAGTLAVPDTPCAHGDSLQIEITTTGASGTQGQGVNVIVWIREEG
jgi:hypothetical protein